MNLAWRIYQRLAQAFPHEFKLAYGDDVMQLGEDVVEQVAKREGAAGLIRLIADIAVRVPIEYLSEMRRDMRYAARALIKAPGFALVGIVSMGLGIGLTTNVYSSGWALLTRELPAAANAKRLVMPEKPVSYYYIEQYRAQKSLFAGVAALENGVPFNVGLEDHLDSKPERIFGQLVSPDYFSVLGVQAQRGRLLDPELDKPGDASVVVISDRFWRSHLNSSPDAVGQTLRLNGQNATIVGITPKNFDGALSMNPAELFVPITAPATLAPELGNDVLHQRNAKEFLAVMWLAPGVTIDSAEAALDGITRRLDEQDPSAPVRADKAKRVVLLPAGTRAPIPRNMRLLISGFFVVLMGIVMTIACMNLATMLLARGANRRKEFAIRLGVGASRFRLVRQMVSEGILLSLLGGIAGFALAYVLSVLNAQMGRPAGAPLGPVVSMDWRAAIFAFALAVVCGVGFSLAPALQATNSDVAPALKDGSALQLSGYRRFGLRNLAMVAQLTGSLMLLLVTGYLVMGLAQVNNVETRFDPKTMVLVSIDPMHDGYTPEKAKALFEKLPERLRDSGVVGSFALAADPPFSSKDPDDAGFQLTAEDSRIQKTLISETVGAGYFAALNEPMLAGREFEERDQRIQIQRIQTQRDLAQRDQGSPGQPDTTKAAASPAVVLPVILNQSAARAFFGNGNALGKRLRDDRQSYEVVGVVGDSKNASGVRQSISYLPLTQQDFARSSAGGITILARADADSDALSGIRSVIASIDPKLTIFNVQTLNEYLEFSRYTMRAGLRTYGGIGLFGLLLSAIGLAGITAYTVAQRRKEIGIRMALGARKAQMLRLVLREGMALIAVGTVLGFLGAVAMAKVLSSLTSVFADALKVSTSDPRLLVGAPLLLIGVSLLACYLPARKATGIDPFKALRQE
ncbi:MAG TPA: ADOP family duplicated permease [Silvibacterium sp.]|nr:ADOP family duplicated permease [Silvibacterium sp.]